MKNKIKDLINSHIINNFILILIVLNALTLGIETFELPVKIDFVLDIFNRICVAIFILEILLKLIADGKSFFKEKWNLFDLCIVSVSILPEIKFLSSARVFRLARILKVFRTTRIVSKIVKLRKIIQALLCALPSIGWTLVLLAIIYYIFAIIGTNLYSTISPEYFGDLWKSFYTLFQITMADDLGNISRPIISAQTSSVIYFIAFIVLATILVLNVIIGIVVDSIEEVKKENEKKGMQKEDEHIYEVIVSLEKQIDLLKAIVNERK